MGRRGTRGALVARLRVAEPSRRGARGPAHPGPARRLRGLPHRQAPRLQVREGRGRGGGAGGAPARVLRPRAGPPHRGRGLPRPRGARPRTEGEQRAQGARQGAPGDHPLARRRGQALLPGRAPADPGRARAAALRGVRVAQARGLLPGQRRPHRPLPRGLARPPRHRPALRRAVPPGDGRRVPGHRPAPGRARRHALGRRREALHGGRRPAVHLPFPRGRRARLRGARALRERARPPPARRQLP